MRQCQPSQRDEGERSEATLLLGVTAPAKAHASASAVEGVVQRQSAAEVERRVELGALVLHDPSLAGTAVAEPPAERCADAILLDRSPEPPRPIDVTSLGSQGRENTDAEDASAVIAHSVRKLERLAGFGLRVVEPPRLERQRR
jgi:hypothetical protein